MKHQTTILAVTIATQACFFAPSGSEPPESPAVTETGAHGTSTTQDEGSSSSEPTTEVTTACGDGAVDPGEDCDDANDIDGDACTNECTLATCGDGVKGPGEGCDDGNAVNDDACSDACVASTCGDGQIQGEESCDAGGESPTCNSNCTPNACGDNVVNTSAGETCDDGGTEGDDGCSAACLREICGDGIVQGAEACDNGPTDDACSPQCHEQRVLQVTTGHRHTCALVSGGVVKCWGLNDHGQLGLGTTEQIGDEPDEMGSALAAVDLGAEPAIAVSAGSFFTCALLQNGSVKCWGHNAYGQLGLGHTKDRGDQPGEMGGDLPAVELASEVPTTELAVGGYHSCAVLADGGTKCWGHNLHGHLGLGDTNDRGDDEDEMGANLLRVDLEGGLTPQQVAPANSHTCALLNGGIVRCWGDGSLAESGLETLETWGDQPGEMGANLPSVKLGNGAVALALGPGREHTCVLLAGGAIKCWGRGVYGGLGSGSEANIGDAPNEMGDALPSVPLGAGHTAMAVSAGHYATCVLLQDGSVKCWGYNKFGQLGLGDTEDRGDQPGEMGDALPTVALGLPTQALRRGPDAHSACAILVDHSLKCWGWNSNGQLGLGDVDDRGDEPGEMGDALPRVKLFSDEW